MGKYSTIKNTADAKRIYDDALRSPPGFISADVETPSLTDQTPLGVWFALPTGEAYYIPIDEPDFPYHLFDGRTRTRVIWYNAPFDLGRKCFGPHVDLDKVEDAIIPTLSLIHISEPTRPY